MRALLATLAVSAIFYAGLSTHHPYGVAVINRTLSRALHKATLGWHQYQAPLFNCERSGRHPNTYVVALMEDYTFGQHKRTAAGVRFDDIVEDVFSIASQVFYSARLNDGALKAVRADVGVDLVECDRPLPLLQGLKGNA